MNQNVWRREELEAYLDEALPAERMRAIELAIRENPDLQRELLGVIARRNQGVFSLAEIWRRNRLTCPGREVLGAYLLKSLSSEEARFVEIHLSITGCRYCLANLEDLKSHLRRDDAAESASARRRDRYFRSSLHHLPSRKAQAPEI